MLILKLIWESTIIFTDGGVVVVVVEVVDVVDVVDSVDAVAVVEVSNVCVASMTAPSELS
jgi:hypothetical protein